MTEISVLTVELLAEGLQWHDGVADRIPDELARLDALPYFRRESHFLGDARQLVVIGVLSHTSEHGRVESFRVRVEYPDRFPGAVLAVFDHEQRFEPSARGHLYSDWQLCLTFPERGEFAIGAADLSEQVLGAALIWFHKRTLFERNGRKDWPGPDEPHGRAPARVLLLLEQSGLLTNPFFVCWVVWILQSGQAPRYQSPCPCNSGRALVQCHAALAQKIYAAIATRR